MNIHSPKSIEQQIQIARLQQQKIETTSRLGQISKIQMKTTWQIQ